MSSSSKKTRLSSAKSLPDFKVLKMPSASQPKPKKPPERPRWGGVSRNHTLDYHEDHYNPKVLVGSWQEQRIIDALPKTSFQEAYVLSGAADCRPKTSTYRRNFLRADVNDLTTESYKVGRQQCLRNKLAAESEAPDNVYRPQPDTSLHDKGAARHTLYHQSYTLRNPKASGSEMLIAPVGQPEIKYGLWEKKMAKWAKYEKDANVMWKSTYQMTYPIAAEQPATAEAAVERKFLTSKWRREEGNYLKGNPHVLSVDSQPELDHSHSATTANNAKKHSPV